MDKKKKTGSLQEVKEVFTDESVSDVITEYIPMSSSKKDEKKTESKPQKEESADEEKKAEELTAVLNDLEKSSPEPEFPETHEKKSPAVPGPVETKEKRGSGAKGILFLVVLLLLLVAVGVGFYTLFTRAKDAEEEAMKAPTPAPAFIQPTSEEPATPVPSTSPEEATPSATPAADVDMKDIKVRIENGTTIAGEAGRWKTFLEDAGYTVVSVGNSSDQTQTETIIRANAKGQPFVSKLIEDLKEKAEASESETSLSESTTYDILVTIGKSST